MTVELARVIFDQIPVGEFRKLIKDRGHLGVLGTPRFQIGDVVTDEVHTGVVAGISINTATHPPVWRYDVHVFDRPVGPMSFVSFRFVNEAGLTLISGVSE